MTKANMASMKKIYALENPNCKVFRKPSSRQKIPVASQIISMI